MATAVTSSKESGLISRFLSSVRSNLSSGVVKGAPCPAILVLSNEACDLDSTVSGLMWAYLMTERRSRSLSSSESSTSITSSSRVTYIPVCNIRRSELELRRDIVWVLEQVSVSESDLFFADDSIISSLISGSSRLSSSEAASEMSAELVSVHLVDHNRLSIFQEEQLAEYVNCIVDHHKDEGRYLSGAKVRRDLDSDRIRKIERCSSNVSNILHLARTIDDGAYRSLFDDHCWRELVKCTTAADTQALFKGDDSDMFALVWSLGMITEEGFSDEHYYKFEDESLKQKIQSVIDPLFRDVLLPKRNDLDGFDMARRLLKDCKFAAVDVAISEGESGSDIQKTRRVLYGVPGAGLRFRGFCSLFADSMHSTLLEFLGDRRLHFGILMTVFTDEDSGEFSRELCLFSHKKEAELFAVISGELDKPNELFQFERIDLDEMEDYRSVKKNDDLMISVWTQKNVKSSRKQLMPVVTETLLRCKI